MRESTMTSIITFGRYKCVANFVDSMRIALDVESVLAEPNEPVLNTTERLSRDEIESEWNFEPESYQIYMGVSDAIWRHKPEIIPPEEPNMSEYVAEWREDHTVDILTHREHVDKQVQWWLAEHSIEYDDFIATDKPKWEFDYDLWIDDNPEMFGECRLLLRHQPWNRQCPDGESKSCDRIHSLSEVSDFL